MKQLFSLFLFIVFLVLPNYSLFAKCWDIRERSLIDGFSQLGGRYIFSVKDARTCQPIKNATLTLKNQTYQSNDDGYFIIDIGSLDLGFDDYINIKLEKDGYIELNELINVELEIPRQTKFLMSEGIAFDSLRLVLQWGETPSDLDLHLKCQNFHISYRNNKDTIQKANLDRDDQDGFGPETITYHDAKSNENCEIYVDNYSGETGYSGDAFVYVYAENQLKKKVNIAPSTKRKATIAKIKNKQINFR